MIKKSENLEMIMKIMFIIIENIYEIFVILKR